MVHPLQINTSSFFGTSAIKTEHTVSRLILVQFLYSYLIYCNKNKSPVINTDEKILDKVTPTVTFSYSYQISNSSLGQKN